jgi:hypothetical protein
VSGELVVVQKNMITQDQIMSMILEACPSFQKLWDESDNQDLLYVVMGDLSRHLLDLYQKGQTDEFNPLCETIETFHTNGDSFVKEFATIGILEAIQNVWGNTDIDPEEFHKFLLPESRKWWKKLNDFWAGKIPHVGAGLHNK